MACVCVRACVRTTPVLSTTPKGALVVLRYPFGQSPLTFDAGGTGMRLCVLVVRSGSVLDSRWLLVWGGASIRAYVLVEVPCLEGGGLRGGTYTITRFYVWREESGNEQYFT